MSKDFVLNGPFDVELKVHVEAARKHAATIMHMLGLIPEHNAEQFDELQAYIEKALAPAPEDRIERESTIAELDPLFPATGVDIEYTDGNVAPAAQPSAPADGDVALEEAYQEGYEAGMIEGRDDAISIDKDLFRMLSAWVFEKTGTSWSDFPDGRSPHDLIDMLDEHFRSFKSPSLLAVERGWRTIDSAPKDGRDILLWWRLCKNPSVGRWSIDDAFDQHDEEWPCPEEGWRSDGDQCIPRNQSDCTHWMPLPAAPDTDMGER